MGVAGSGERGMPLSESWSVQMRDADKGKDFRYVFKLKIYSGGEWIEVRADDPNLTDGQRRTIQTHLAAAYAVKGVNKDLATSKRFNLSKVDYHSEHLETVSNANVKPIYPPQSKAFGFKRGGDQVRFQKNIHEVWKVLQNRPGHAGANMEEIAQAHEAHQVLPMQPVAQEPARYAEFERLQEPPNLHFPRQMEERVKEPLDNSMRDLQEVIHEAPILARHPEAAKHLEALVKDGRELLEHPQDHKIPKKMDESVEAFQQELERSAPKPQAAIKAPREFKKAQVRPAAPPKVQLQEGMDKFLRGTLDLAKAVDKLSEQAEEIPQASIDTTPHKKADLGKLWDAAKALNTAILGLHDELQPQEDEPLAQIQEESKEPSIKGLLEKAKGFSSSMQEAVGAFQNAEGFYEDTVETLQEAYSEEQVGALLDFSFLKKAPPEPVVEQAVAVTSVYVEAVKELEVPPPPKEDIQESLHPANVLKEIKKESPISSKIPPPQNFYADALRLAFAKIRPSLEGEGDVGDDDDDIAVESKKAPEPIERKTEKRPVDEAKQKAAIEKLKKKAATVPKGSSLLEEIQQGAKLAATEKGQKISPPTSQIEEELKKNVEQWQSLKGRKPKKP